MGLRELKDIKNQGRVITAFKVFFLVWGFIMYQNFKYGESFYGFSWWILSFNLLILVTLAIKGFREKMVDHHTKTERSLVSKIDLALKQEIKANTIKEKSKIHGELDKLFSLSSYFPKSPILSRIAYSFSLAIAYLAFYSIGGHLINVPFLSEEFLFMNLVLIIPFLTSLYFVTEMVITIVWSFKGEED